MDNIKNTEYDEYPYDAYAFHNTSPILMHTNAKLFGVDATDIEKARILELGCGDGTNLLQFAKSYPEAKILGVDLSQVQIDIGNKIINDLELKNIELKCVSITDMDESYGKFDYIICHGVFSWVPDEVSKKILELSKKLLSDNGIAIISYNVLPGWNMQQTIRDMMLFHSDNFINVHDKVNQSMMFLDFTSKALKAYDKPYGKFLSDNIDTLSKMKPSYIRHEYLCEFNKPIYFYEFINKAKEYSLNYLSDAQIQSMYIGNLPAIAQEKLSTITNIVHVEQYMDFINNRKFRSTLLTHDHTPINRNLKSSDIDSFYTRSNFKAENVLTDLEINSNNEIRFSSILTDNGFTASNPLIKAIMCAYSENVGNYLKIDEIIKIANIKLQNVKYDELKSQLNNIILQLIFSGLISISTTKPKTTYEISAKPKATDLARYQVSIGKDYVINEINNMLFLDKYQLYIISLLDGNNSIDVIVEHLYNKVVAGNFIVTDNNTKEQITDKSKLKEYANIMVINFLETLKINQLLVS